MDDPTTGSKASQAQPQGAVQGPNGGCQRSSCELGCQQGGELGGEEVYGMDYSIANCPPQTNATRCFNGGHRTSSHFEADSIPQAANSTTKCSQIGSRQTDYEQKSKQFFNAKDNKTKFFTHQEPTQAFQTTDTKDGVTYSQNSDGT